MAMRDALRRRRGRGLDLSLILGAPGEDGAVPGPEAMEKKNPEDGEDGLAPEVEGDDVRAGDVGAEEVAAEEVGAEEVAAEEVGVEASPEEIMIQGEDGKMIKLTPEMILQLIGNNSLLGRSMKK